MSVYRPAPTSEVPVLHLSAWRIFKIKSKLRRLSGAVVLVGRDESTGHGRVSSALKKWNAATREAITQSGRVYKIVGDSGMSLDAAYVFDVWCKRWRVTNTTDVTARYEKKVKAAKAPKLKRKVAA